VDLLIERGVRVASFALAPKPEFIERLKAAGSVVIPSIGAAKHARKVADWGADAVIVQGGEGGGHTGGVATTLLLPSVLDAGDTRAGVLASGQVVGMLDDLPTCRELIEAIIAEAEAIIGKLPSALE